MLNQLIAVTGMNLRSVPHRLAPSIVLVIGVAGVVGVLVSVLAMASGLGRTLASTGAADRAVVMHKSAETEGFSNIDISWVGTVANAPGVMHGPDGTAAVCPEYVAAAGLPRRSNGSRASVLLRGTCAATFLVHPHWKLVAGRWFKPGLREIVVGTGAATEFSHLGVGQRVKIGDSLWTVVGHMKSRGDAHESEILTDARTLMSAFHWGSYSSVTVRLTSPTAFDRFRAALLANPTLQVHVMRERDYYRGQSKSVAGLLTFVSTVVGAIMAVGAAFTALNTMYSAVAGRTTEIATLRALGFKPPAVVASVVVEAMLLALLGALIGAAVAWLLFNGVSLNTEGADAFGSQVAFKLLVSPRIVVVGIIWACAIGLIGGLLPALRAARLPVASALRPA